VRCERRWVVGHRWERRIDTEGLPMQEGELGGVGLLARRDPSGPVGRDRQEEVARLEWAASLR
jgi:hypothetical protein